MDDDDAAASPGRKVARNVCVFPLIARSHSLVFCHSVPHIVDLACMSSLEYEAFEAVRESGDWSGLQFVNALLLLLLLIIIILQMW